MRMAHRLKPWSLWFAVVVVLAGAVNLLWLLAETEKDRGGALHGFVHDGHYSLAQLGAPLVFACLVYLLLGGVCPLAIALRQGEAVTKRVQAVRTSGRILARASCSGSVAGFGLGFPAALAIELYPDGLTIRVLLEPTVAILKEELRHVEVPKGRIGGRVEIDYRSPDLQPPLKLSLARTSDFAVALGRFMEPTETRVE